MEQFTGCEASPKRAIVNVRWHNAWSPGDLCLSSSHVTSHKHWHTDAYFLSIQYSYLDQTDFFCPLTQATATEEAPCIAGREEKKKRISYAHTPLRSLCSITQSSNSGGIQLETVSLVTVTGSDLFFSLSVFSLSLSLSLSLPAFISLSFLCLSPPFWMSHWEDGDGHTPRPWQCTVLLLSGKHGWVVCSSVITNVKELFISSNPSLYSLVCMYIYIYTHTHTHTHARSHSNDTRSIHSK